ncbi:MAG: hypothetical protein JO034_17120 [Singulisphaera sp.]|nr:hypothetical protein [Singulisphaera sp.]
MSRKAPPFRDGVAYPALDGPRARTGPPQAAGHGPADQGRRRHQELSPAGPWRAAHARGACRDRSPTHRPDEATAWDTLREAVAATPAPGTPQVPPPRTKAGDPQVTDNCPADRV